MREGAREDAEACWQTQSGLDEIGYSDRAPATASPTQPNLEPVPMPSRIGTGAEATEGKPKAPFAFIPGMSRSWQAAHDRFWRLPGVTPRAPAAYGPIRSAEE